MEHRGVCSPSVLGSDLCSIACLLHLCEPRCLTKRGKAATPPSKGYFEMPCGKRHYKAESIAQIFILILIRVSLLLALFWPLLQHPHSDSHKYLSKVGCVLLILLVYFIRPHNNSVMCDEHPTFQMRKLRPRCVVRFAQTPIASKCPALILSSLICLSQSSTSFNRDAVKAGTGRRFLGGLLDHSSYCYTLEVSFYSYVIGGTTAAVPYTEEACILGESPQPWASPHLEESIQVWQDLMGRLETWSLAR